jgi:hypothetical protein
MYTERPPKKFRQYHLAKSSLSLYNREMTSVLRSLGVLGIFLVGLVTNSFSGPLDWVESALPGESYRKDATSGKYRFYATFGYAEDIPSVGVTTFAKCYSGKVELTRMQGTSDVIEDAKQGVFDARARDFAREYNLRMKLFIDSKGLSKCAPGADWESATNELNEYVWGKDQQQGTLSDFVDRVPPSLSIAIVDRKRANDVRLATCKILERNGVRETVRVDVSQWLRPPPEGFHTAPIGGFRCSKGVASPLFENPDR